MANPRGSRRSSRPSKNRNIGMNGAAYSTPSKGGGSFLAASFTTFIDSFRAQTVAELLEKGDTAAIDGNNEDALRHYYNALEKERRQSSSSSSSSDNDPSIQSAMILHKIGLALARTGDSFAAMNSFQEALEIRQDRLGPGSEDAAESTAQILKILDEIRVQSGVGERQFVKGENGNVPTLDVGTNLLEWGEYKQAEAVLKECLQSMNDNGESKTGERIKVLGAMAELDQAQGKYDEAKELYLEVLKTAKKMNTDSGEEIDISIINSIAGYAEILRKAGDLWQSEALHKKVRNMLMASKYAKEGTDSDIALHLAVSHTQLGCTVFALKKYDEALQEHQSALNIRLGILEVTDALVSESFNYCAETLCAIGREAEALPLSLQAVDIRAREFGTSHPAYAHALSVLSKCYHGVGRSRDAMPLIEKCLDICQTFFSPNHANIIPNLIVQGDVLQAVGELERSMAVFQRAESIHEANFSNGQKEFQLEEIQQKLKDVMNMVKYELDMDPSVAVPMQNGEKKICGGTPIIVITDVGRDIDDALALVALSSLKQMFILNPRAIITTLPPEKDRARLARKILDSLGMDDVPVGIGTEVACPGEITLNCFGGLDQVPFHFERGSTLMARVLSEAEPKSVKILCMANLKDLCELTLKHESLFRTKVKEVVIMGGARYSGAREQLVPDETASNNSADLEAARHVYAECQQSQIPTTTISRYAAYGCPLSISFLDRLQSTHHLLAGEIRNANFKAMQQLWRRVNMPSWMPGRGKLPSRCNKEWFLDFFHVNVDDTTYTSKEIWRNASFFLYDSLAMISCVDPYVDLHFSPKSYLVDGTRHKVIGLLLDGKQRSCVNDQRCLVQEVEGLLHQAFELSLEGIVIPTKGKASEDLDVDKTPNRDNTSNVGRHSDMDHYDEEKEIVQ